MKIVIFGIGNYYKEQKEMLHTLPDVEIVAFSDNNAALWKQNVDGAFVISPDSIKSAFCDKVVIMSIYGREIYEQLVGLGIDKNKIVIWERFRAEMQQQIKGRLRKEYIAEPIKKDILIASYDLNYDGASLAAVYAAIALKNSGRSVVVAASKGADKFIRETVQKGISIVIDPSLPYILEKDREWFKQFKAVIVNTFPMLECACGISDLCPTVWWVHESSPYYATITQKYPNSLNVERFSDINIYAVSKNAQYHFNHVYPERVQNTLPYGIPDMAVHKKVKDRQNKKVVFAVIGALYPLKGQDIFLKAAGRVHSGSRSEFWVIGRYLDKEKTYFETVTDLVAEIDSAKMIGEMTREEIQEAFSQIDVVVCASHEETVSITITEAMMYGKICITTENTGIADYIQDGRNGFIVPSKDIAALAEKMQWVIEHYRELENMELEARKTYEQFFTMELLGKNLEKALCETEQHWKK